MKNNKGITLIALVVTIIVLLILAGVSIAMLSGDNGILTKAGEARDNSAAGSLDEATKIAIGNFLTNDLRWKYSTSDSTNNGAKLGTDLKTEILKVNSKITVSSNAVDDTNSDYVKIVATVDGNDKSQTVYVKINTGAVSTTIPASNP